MVLVGPGEMAGDRGCSEAQCGKPGGQVGQAPVGAVEVFVEPARLRQIAAVQIQHKAAAIGRAGINAKLVGGGGRGKVIGGQPDCGGKGQDALMAAQAEAHIEGLRRRQVGTVKPDDPQAGVAEVHGVKLRGGQLRGGRPVDQQYFVDRSGKPKG